jgi:hypothetical protein
MKAKSSNLILLLNAVIILLATLVYFHGSDHIPTGYHVDHLSNTLNGFCLRWTGADEYGTAWPWNLRAFNDYRPPFLAYIIAFGGFFVPIENHMARVIALIAGFLGCALTMMFIEKNRQFEKTQIPLAPAFIFGFFLLSSWFLLPHRIAAEYCLAVVFYLGLFVTTWLVIETPSKISLGLANGFFVGSQLYVYYGTKVFYFIHFPVVAYFLWRKYKKPYKSKAFKGFFVSVIFALFLALPTFADILGPQLTMQRYHVVKSTSFQEKFNTIKKQLSLKFLFFEGDANRRHHTGYKGELNQFFLPFYLAGLYVLYLEIFRRKNLFFTYLGVIYILSYLPVSLTNEGIPHSIRTLVCLVPLMMITYLGYTHIEKWIFEKSKQRKIKIAGLYLFFIFGIFEAYNNVNYYYTNTSTHDREVWNYFPDSKAWRKPDYSEHGVDSILDRYFLAIPHGDKGYCNGS